LRLLDGAQGKDAKTRLGTDARGRTFKKEMRDRALGAASDVSPLVDDVVASEIGASRELQEK